MERILCKAEFDFIGVPKFIQKFLKDEIIRQHNVYVKAANPKIEGWNNEFEKMFDDEEAYFDNEFYEDWIRGRMSKVANAVCRSIFFDKFWIDEDFYTAGRVRFIPGSEVHFHMMTIDN